LASMTARALVVVLACIAAIAAAQSACPSSTLTSYYTDSTCSTDTSAMSTWCTCIGKTYTSSSNTCTGTSTTSASCATFASCGATYFATLNTAAAAGSSCTGLAALKTPLVTLALGTTNYSSSDVETSCKAVACAIANVSYSTCVSSIDSLYSTLCVNPYTYVLVIVITGNFLCNDTSKATLTVAFKTDATNKFGYTVTIISFSCGSISSTFSLPISGLTSGLAAKIIAAAADSSWLTALAAALGVSTSALVIASLAQSPSPAPGSLTLSSGRATWTIMSLVAAVLAFAF